MRMSEGWIAAQGVFTAKSAEFVQALLQPKLAQERLLGALVRENRATAFGREHGFADIQDWADYRARVPIRKYEDFAPYIARILAGEAAVLTSDPIEFVEQTGGSSGGSKSIPFTRMAIDGFLAALHPWMDDLISRRPGITSGRGYFALSPVGRTGHESVGGLRLGSGDNFTFFGEAKPFLNQISLVAMPISRISDLEEWRFLTCLYLLSAEDLSFIWVWSPTYITTLLSAMRRNRERLVSVLAQGIDLPAPDGKEGRFVIPANPERARQVERSLTSGAVDTMSLWPRLDTISCWMDAASASFGAELKNLFPHVYFQPKGLISTECALSFPYTSSEEHVLALLSTFAEFIDEAGESALFFEVKKGNRYRIVISTHSGLYRYDTGDIVEISGFVGLTPTLLFVGRGGISSDLCGEKLTDEFLSRCLGELALLPGQCAFVAPSEEQRPPRYILFLDALETSRPREISDQLELCLSRNPQYAYARSLGQLAPLEVWPIVNLMEKYMNFALAGGRLISGLKVPALAPKLGGDWVDYLRSSGAG